MTDLQLIERRLLELTSAFDLRPSLEKAADIGDLLIEARSMVRHGEWGGWLARLRLHRRTAWDHMAVARARVSNRWPATQMTIKGFLSWVRRASNSAKESQRAEAREKARKAQGELPDSIILAYADCREYPWPEQLDLAVCDPPWSDLAHYEWLATWAAEHLREGGLALVQCGQKMLPDVMTILGNHLSYIWTMSIGYSENNAVAARGRFVPIWKPVLVYSKGKPSIPETVSDMYLMDVSATEKHFHPWEQPLAPWRYWLSKLARPGEHLGDPYAGSGTLAAVCLDLSLRYTGTEADEETYRVARGRIRKAHREAEGASAKNQPHRKSGAVC